MGDHVGIEGIPFIIRFKTSGAVVTTPLWISVLKVFHL